MRPSTLVQFDFAEVDLKSDSEIECGQDYLILRLMSFFFARARRTLKKFLSVPVSPSSQFAADRLSILGANIVSQNAQIDSKILYKGRIQLEVENEILVVKLSAENFV